MPNHITNRIVFDSKEQDRVIRQITTNGQVDFNRLIPMPIHVYAANTTQEDEQDFKLNWWTWCRENWGTKWNAYETEIFSGAITFKTAWSVSYPFIVAFANTLKMKFVHEYIDEGFNFWGVDEWSREEHSELIFIAKRISKRLSLKEDEKRLAMELLHYSEEEYSALLNDRSKYNAE